MSVTRQRRPHRGITAAGFAAVIAFAVLAGRFWHPYYGFTKFVQLDELDARNGIHEIRENPVFVYPGENGYDGAAYTQIAFHPLLDSAELKPALGNVPYRARRILGSALAWLFAGGNPARIAQVYAALNLAVWLALAALLWRALAVSNLRSLVAWVGVMFSAGALHSVRLALTDLLGATLVAAAIWLSERGRHGGAIGAMASAGLARETALANIVALWRGPWKSRGAWVGNLARTAVVALPLFLWIIYVHWKAGPAAQGFGNFSWPVAGWVEKGITTVAEYSRSPGFRWLNTTTLLALIGLTVQAVFLLRRPHWKEAWWRAGACGAVMMLLLGTSVWEGHPGAATRVLLPMSVAFAVVAIREHATWPWIAGGSLSVFSGVLALWNVPHDPREIAAGRYSEGAFVARLELGWFGAERDRRVVWSWSAGRAELAIETVPRVSGATKVRLKLRAIDPRVVEISEAGAVIWRGEIGERLTWIEFNANSHEGRIQLAVQSAAEPRRENENADARSLNFAVYGVQLK
jgi:hypothetical protein